MTDHAWEAVESRLGLVSLVVALSCLATVGLASALTWTDSWGVRIVALCVALLTGLAGAFLSLRPFLEPGSEAEQVMPAVPAAMATRALPDLKGSFETGTRLEHAGLPSAELEAQLNVWVDDTAALLEQSSPQLAGYFRAANAGDRPPEERLAKAVARLHTILHDVL